jgi:2-polyprenyl-3-methyl-5-hydroxy-6-metoxy-1,4-benzoquinol methylase
VTETAAEEVAQGRRFAFGANWSRFLGSVDDSRIAAAEASLRDMLGQTELPSTSFLDIGCGSGLFSLAARRLGARVRSFDFDPQSVACARELRRRYASEDDDWCVEQGSVLDRQYMDGLGSFDIVYSWGVLHHTGALWLGLEHAISRVVPNGGRLWIAIYNDQGWRSHAWWFVKAVYNGLPSSLRPAFAACVSVTITTLVTIKYAFKLRPMEALRPLLADRRERGMSAKYDRLDWIGGFPFEFATVEVLTRYLEARGFTVVRVVRNTSNGCNEFVAKRSCAV